MQKLNWKGQRDNHDSHEQGRHFTTHGVAEAGMNTDIPRILHQGQLVHLLPADGRGHADPTLPERAARCVDVEECFVYVLTASGDQFCYRNGLRIDPAREHWPLTPEQVQSLYQQGRRMIIDGHLRGVTFTSGPLTGQRERVGRTWGSGWLPYPTAPVNAPETSEATLQAFVNGVLETMRSSMDASDHAELKATLDTPLVPFLRRHSRLASLLVNFPSEWQECRDRPQMLQRLMPYIREELRFADLNA